MELTVEFLCTLRVEVDDLPNEMLESIIFRVVGMTISITMWHFCTAFGLYKDHKMEDPTHERLTFALVSFPYTLLWRRCSDSDICYTSNIVWASLLHSYAMCYLHRVMA